MHIEVLFYFESTVPFGFVLLYSTMELMHTRSSSCASFCNISLARLSICALCRRIFRSISDTQRSYLSIVSFATALTRVHCVYNKVQERVDKTHYNEPNISTQTLSSHELGFRQVKHKVMLNKRFFNSNSSACDFLLIQYRSERHNYLTTCS